MSQASKCTNKIFMDGGWGVDGEGVTVKDACSRVAEGH